MSTALRVFSVAAAASGVVTLALALAILLFIAYDAIAGKAEHAWWRGWVATHAAPEVRRLGRFGLWLLGAAFALLFLRALLHCGCP